MISFHQFCEIFFKLNAIGHSYVIMKLSLWKSAYVIRTQTWCYFCCYSVFEYIHCMFIWLFFVFSFVSSICCCAHDVKITWSYFWWFARWRFWVLARRSRVFTLWHFLTLSIIIKLLILKKKSKNSLLCHDKIFLDKLNRMISLVALKNKIFNRVERNINRIMISHSTISIFLFYRVNFEW